MGPENQEDEVNVAMNPEEIERRDFSSSLRGYDKGEVRSFLRRVADEVGRLQNELTGSVSAPPTAPVAEGRADIPEDWPLPPGAATSTWDGGDVPEALRGPETPADDRVDLDLPFADEDGDATAPEADQAWATESFSSEVAEPSEEPADTFVTPVDEPASFFDDPAGYQTEDAPAPAAAPTVDDDEDRFQALGERIAGLLRSAHESANVLRENAENEAEQTRQAARNEAEQTRLAAQDAANELVSAAEGDAERIRGIANDDAQRIMDEANADAEAKRAEADRLNDEARETLAQAEVDAAAMKEQAIVDGNAALDARTAEVEAREAASQADREAAMAELADAREQVAGLLQEARTQSDFIRHEAEDIIRTKIRSNLEQAEQRLNVLRNSEVASRDRIAKAHQELAGALSRLEAELPPELEADAEQLAIDEAKAKGEATGYGMEALASGFTAPGVAEVEAPAEPEFIDTDVIDSEVVETPDVDVTDAEVVEAEVVEVPFEAETEIATESADDVTAAEPFAGFTAEVPSFDAPVEAVETTEVDTPEVADEVAEEAAPIDAFGTFEPTVEEALLEATPVETPDTSIDEAFAAAQVDAWQQPTEESLPVREVGGSFEEPAQAEYAASADYNPATDFDSPATMAEALGAEEEPADPAESEDALARLVREAMQRAVENARSGSEG